MVWNSSGYDRVEMLARLEGLVQIYMPDLKYVDGKLSQKYSGAENYPEAALAAIEEMYRQAGPYELDGEGVLRSGVLIRHLILPGCTENSLDVIDMVAERFPGGEVLFSLMSQYTPAGKLGKYPELDRTLDSVEHGRAGSYLRLSGIEAGYFQELESASEAFIPVFDLTGI